MKRRKWAVGLICALLAMVVLAGAANASGGQGSQENPLVTLSYLNEVVVPNILKQVEEKLDGKAEELKSQVAGEKAAFVSVEIPAGGRMTVSAGSQLLPRSGMLLTVNPLVDMTDGTTWDGDTSGLRANHLYLSTGDGQAVYAATASTVLVQGSYMIQ